MWFARHKTILSTAGIYGAADAAVPLPTALRGDPIPQLEANLREQFHQLRSVRLGDAFAQGTPLERIRRDDVRDGLHAAVAHGYAHDQRQQAPAELLFPFVAIAFAIVPCDGLAQRRHEPEPRGPRKIPDQPPPPPSDETARPISITIPRRPTSGSTHHLTH